MNVVITGTSRGIGRELLHIAAGRGDRVLAIRRGAPPAGALDKNIESLALDLTDPELSARLSAALGDWSSVDVLINDAGVYATGDSTEDFLRSFHVNTVAPYHVTKALLPWLKKSKSPRAAHVTSKMGSIADNSGGGHYAYRASKTALNMINRSLAVDHPWLATVVLHPGWVKTDMGGKMAPLSIEASAAGLWKVIDHLDPKASGKFMDYRGETIPW